MQAENGEHDTNGTNKHSLCSAHGRLSLSPLENMLCQHKDKRREKNVGVRSKMDFVVDNALKGKQPEFETLDVHQATIKVIKVVVNIVSVLAAHCPAAVWVTEHIFVSTNNSPDVGPISTAPTANRPHAVVIDVVEA